MPPGRAAKGMARQAGNEAETSNENSMTKTMIMAAALIGIAAPAHAQIVEKKTLNLEWAKTATAAAVDYAKKSNAPGAVIAVGDEGGNLMALERLYGTFAMGATISVG